MQSWSLARASQVYSKSADPGLTLALLESEREATITTSGMSSAAVTDAAFVADPFPAVGFAPVQAVSPAMNAIEMAQMAAARIATFL